LISESGEPEIADIEEFIGCLKKWLGRPENQSLTVRTIFESLDTQNFGELTESKFEIAMHKIGVELRPKDKRILRDTLDPRNLGFLKYRPLLRELQGIPMLDFESTEVIRLAKSLVDARDLTEDQFKRLIDPASVEMMSLTQLQESISQVKNEHFSMSNEEVELLFKHVAKCQRTLGVNLSITKLTQRVFRAVDALLIERMRDSVSKSMKSLPELLKRFDSNNDGFLEHHELESLFLDC
jgi:hypothetical protein